MQIPLSYLGRSGLHGSTLRFSPNLSRPEVSFQGILSDPVLYREAMSVLYAVVTSDLQAPKKTEAQRRSYQGYQERWQSRLDEARMKGESEETDRMLQDLVPEARTLREAFQKAHLRYWTARHTLSRELITQDPTLWGHLIPCDPLITVAPDAVLFEVFSKDESSYASLSIDRGFFDRPSDAPEAAIGTTNVDFSPELFAQLQQLRSYRAAMLSVDPQGFEVEVAGLSEHREEKIDLPISWLYGFGQLQAALMLGGLRVKVGVSALHGLLAFLKRHREKSGPRALRFELVAGGQPQVVVEPWGFCIPLGGTWAGATTTVRVWGRRRLMALERLLPLVAEAEVLLVGDGLPSVWCFTLLGRVPVRLTLALSGWTASSWTGRARGWADGAALELLLGGEEPTREELVHARGVLVGTQGQAMTLGELEHRRVSGAALRVLARRGMVFVDPGRSVVRWRMALGEEELPEQPPHEELVGARLLLMRGHVHFSGEVWEEGAGLRVRSGTFDDLPALPALQDHPARPQPVVTVSQDSDQRIRAGHCACSWNFRYRLKSGPCRHILALSLLKL